MIELAIFSAFSDVLPEMIGGAIILLLGWLWGQWQSMRSWRTKEFKNRVVLALNTFRKEDDKSKLVLRTIFEKDIRLLLQNDSMAEIVTRAIDGTTPSDPILRFSKDDSWYILNAVLNQICQEFSSGTIRKDMGEKVASKWYTFCFTFEKDGALRMQKIRIMLIGKDDLAHFPDEDGKLSLESERHSTRIQTLRIMKKEIKENPHLFLDVEICQ